MQQKTFNEACGAGDLPTVQRLFETGKVDLNGVDDETTPLHRAASGGHLAVVQWLAANGAKLDLRCERTPVSTWDDDPTDLGSPFTAAAVRSHFEVAEWLLAQGVAVSEEDWERIYSSSEQDPQILSWMVATEPRLVGQGQEKIPYLWLFWLECMRGSLENAKRFFSVCQGCFDVNRRYEGSTPLQIAREQGHRALQRWLEEEAGAKKRK